MCLVNKLIQTGATYGNFTAESIIHTPQTVSNHTSLVADDKRHKLRTYLAKQSKQGVAITADIWIDDFKKNSYLGMNVHFIESGAIRERTLCVQEIKGPQNVENVFSVMKTILDEFSIEMKNVVFVTDRGGNRKVLVFNSSTNSKPFHFTSGNLILALKEPNIRINCTAHLINNIVHTMLDTIKS